MTAIRAIVSMAIKPMGSPAGLASALGVDVSTVYRWVREGTDLTGARRVALLAIIENPDRYRHHYIAPGRPGRKPAGEPDGAAEPMETKRKGD